MIIIKITIIILVAIGLFLILNDLLHIPFLKTSKAIKNLSKKQGNKSNNVEVWLEDLASFIAKYIKINEYKKMQLVSDLETADVNETPEVFTAKAIIKAFLYGLIMTPILFVFPLAIILIIAVVFTTFFSATKRIQRKISLKRRAIEYELPRLVFTIEKTLVHNRDVLNILDNYRYHAKADLKKELDITVADMRSGNYESALTRLESRVGSSMMSDVVRGLIAVLRGDNTASYWAALNIKFADIQRQNLKLEASKIPAKVRKLSMIMLGCFLLTYVVVIIDQVISGIGVLF